MLLAACEAVFLLCCLGCKSAKVESVIKDSLRTEILRAELRVDTIYQQRHDSVYLREVVTTTGDTIYRERTAYRDRVKLQYRDRVLYDTLYITRAREEKTATTEKPTKERTNHLKTTGLIAVWVGIFALLFWWRKKKN